MTAHPGSDSTAPVLVGRARELDALRGALDAALAGRGRLILLAGEAGIGKTALARALAREARARGATVLLGRAYDLSEAPPHGIWLDLRDPAAPGGPAAPLDAPLAALHSAGAAGGQAARFDRAFAALAQLARDRPLVLVLDDLHWADPASIDLLRFAARQLAALPMLIVGTYRADELAEQHHLAVLLPALVREAEPLRVALPPLEEAATRQLVRSGYALPPGEEDRLIAYLQARAAGNPLYLGELLRTLEEERLLRADAGGGWALADLAGLRVPPLLRQVIAGRLGRLGEEAQRRLAVAAVIGQEVLLDLWTAVAGADEEALLALVERATAARVLEATPDGLRAGFHHPLIRHALYEGLSPPRRRAVHRRVADLLAASPQPDPDAVADHLQRAGDPRAVEWLERAGERAQRAYAWLTAAARYEAALVLLEAGDGDVRRRGWLTFHLAALRRVADTRRALADAEAAVRLADAAGDPLLAALGTFLAGMLRSYPAIRDRHRGIPLMEAGLNALAALPPAARVPPGMLAPVDLALRWGTVVSHLASAGRYGEALERGERYLAEVAPPLAADWLGGNPHADAQHGLGLVYAGLGQPSRARAALARARTLFDSIGHHHMAAGVAWDEALVAEWYESEHQDELARLLARVRAASGRATGVAGERAGGRPWDIPGLLRGGRWGELREVALGIVDAADDAYVPELGWFDRAQGRSDAAWARVRRAFPDGPATAPGDADLLFTLPLQRLAAALALDEGDHPAAHAWLAAHDRWLAWSGAVLGRADGHLSWAAYHRAAGDAGQARDHAERALADATGPRQPLALLAAHRVLGKLDTEASRHAEAAAHLDAALALADACAAPYERALTLLALAELRASTGARDDAEAPLAAARALLVPLGVAPALARADALAATLAPVLAASPAGVTPREGEVLRLVVAGRSNREIAGTLSVSERTVERHLENAYRKLGARNRADAVAFAIRHHLT